MEYIMAFGLFWGLVLFGPIGAAIGSRKGRGWTGFLLGLVLGIFGVIIVALMRGDKRDCPHCGGEVRNWACTCPHCRRGLPD